MENSLDFRNNWEHETPLYNSYHLNPVDMSYNFSYDTGDSIFLVRMGSTLKETLVKFWALS